MADTKRQKQAQDVPVQPVEQPILCNPYEEPTQHWVYDTESGEASLQPERRAAGYWYKTETTGSDQRSLFVEEQRDDLPLVNALRDDVRRWRESGYRGAEAVARELLNHWARADLPRRLFFCQREAVETIIYLAEMRMSGRSSRTGFQRLAVSDDDLQRLLGDERPELPGGSADFFPTLIDRPAIEALLPLTRLGCKMATGSGKTVVMAMLIAWAFCNRGRNRTSAQFPDAVLVCCPNLTVKERLQVLRPDMPGNYYEEFDLVPVKYRPLMQHGKVLITNWHVMNTESEHKEGDATYRVVNKGPETPDDFARRVLTELHDRMPVMVLNDEGHHCWRPAPQIMAEDLDRDEKRAVDEELQEATVWVEGLDRINNALAVSGSPDPDTQADRQVSSPWRPSVAGAGRWPGTGTPDLRPAGGIPAVSGSPSSAVSGSPDPDTQADRQVSSPRRPSVAGAGRWPGTGTPDLRPAGGILFCVDLSATPFYIKGSGHPEGRPFPWVVSDFGLVDAIGSGITQIPRLPVLDTTGRPDPKYFKLWEWIRDRLQPGEKLPGKAGKPKPDVVYREAEGALEQIAGQWVERFALIEAATPGQERVPPVLIIVCDNTDIAELLYRSISGEREEDVVAELGLEGADRVG